MALLRIATRGSALALAQSRWVAGRLQALSPNLQVDLNVIKTTGDLIQNRPLSEIGGKGVFVKEIEQALLDGDADLAVHSLKDLPAQLPEGLIIAAYPEREDPLDVLALSDRAVIPSAPEAGLPLPPGTRVGTSSLRRQAQLRLARADLEWLDIRGNIDTRLRKLDEGQYDAIVLAAAGLRRLGLADRISYRLPATVCIPAPGQGCLGIETREADTELRALLAQLDHYPTRQCVAAERTLMYRVGGSCQVPLGGLAQHVVGGLELRAIVLDPDSQQRISITQTGDPGQPEALGDAVAATLLREGAAEIIAGLKTT